MTILSTRDVNSKRREVYRVSSVYINSAGSEAAFACSRIVIAARTKSQGKSVFLHRYRCMFSFNVFLRVFFIPKEIKRISSFSKSPQMTHVYVKATGGYGLQSLCREEVRVETIACDIGGDYLFLSCGSGSCSNCPMTLMKHLFL